MNNKNNILITGGAGFIGSNIAKKLVADNWNVTILDNFLPQVHGETKQLGVDLIDHVKLIVGDVTDEQVFNNALIGQNAVIHLAAETGTGQSMYNVRHYTNVNILGTSILCDFLINQPNNIETVIVASSRSIYGEGKYFSKKFGEVYPKSRTFSNINNNFDVSCPISGNFDLELLPTDESSKIHPSSFYGITKQVQEQMIIMASRLKKINGYALRYQNVYGPGQSLKNPYTGILSIFTRLALKNELINVFEDGNESRDFVFIDDVVDATISCLYFDSKSPNILNVGSGVPTSVFNVAKEIVSYTKSNSKIAISGTFREGDIRHNYADLQNVKKVIDFQPKWDFKSGLHRFIDWVVNENDIPNDFYDYQRSLGELKEKGFLNE
uniref:NAD-dependent epimerase/dehydratase family protein n=1 Tax=Algoriphagus sp. TaxID=1872435 RepID=UPI004047A9EB